MNRVRTTSVFYRVLMTAATLLIPLLVFFGLRGQGLDAATVTIGAAVAFLLLLAWLVIPDKGR